MKERIDPVGKFPIMRMRRAISSVAGTGRRRTKDQGDELAYNNPIGPNQVRGSKRPSGVSSSLALAKGLWLPQRRIDGEPLEAAGFDLHQTKELSAIFPFRARKIARSKPSLSLHKSM